VRGVEVFPNASIARIDLASMDPKPRRYWDFEFASDIDQSTAELNNEHLDDFKDRLKEAVRRSMDGSNRVGLLLSGGLDSRTIAGAIGELKESGGSSIESFTFGEPHSDDVRFARKISKAIKSNHHYTGVKKERMPEFFQKAVFYQDGMASCKHCHYFHMLDELEQAVEVGLDGFAGDVLPRQMFRSFLSGGVERALSAFQTINATTQREILDPSLEPEIRRSKDRFLYLWQDSFERCSQNPLDHFNLTQRQRKFINYGKISKRNHIEIRTPFTDYDLMDFSLRIPRRFRIKDLITKETLFKFYPRLARIPQAEVGYLRAGNLRTLVYGKVDDWKTRWKWKTSLMDYAGYFRTTLKEFLTGIILTPEFRSRGYFQYSRVQEMLEDHFQRRANHETTIGVLLTFELWCRIFIDRTMDIPTLISKC
jgi:asparagine synthase (glutamine-hydrolysing)